MEQFKQYLLKLGMMDSTIKEHLNNIQRFISWATNENHADVAGVRYCDLLVYIQCEKQNGILTPTIALRLASIRHYYEHLKQQGEITKNPAKTLYLKGDIKTVVKAPLAFTELESLYKAYVQLKKVSHVQEITNLTHQRNSVLLGLLIYQGLHSGELLKMEVEHVKLEQGLVYIPGTSRGNSRELKLEPLQIIPFHSYLNEVRPQLKPKAGELFPGDAHYLIKRLMDGIKGINPGIRDAQHIRASVILHWLKLHNKRQVQYMAGHRWISSTEKYAVQEMDTLKDALKKHHPFG